MRRPTFVAPERFATFAGFFAFAVFFTAGLVAFFAAGFVFFFGAGFLATGFLAGDFFGARAAACRCLLHRRAGGFGIAPSFTVGTSSEEGPEAAWAPYAAAGIASVTGAASSAARSAKYSCIGRK